MAEENKLSNLKVIKRNSKKVDFNGTKIAIAIKKGFDSVGNSDYTDGVINEVYLKVIEIIENDYKERKEIAIEEIQEIIENTLEDLGYSDVHKSFAAYRSRRAASREIFSQRQSKLIRAIEQLSLKDSEESDSKRENANVDGNTAMGTMLQFGSTISKEFAKAYLIKKEFSDAHDEGRIHIHDMDFLPMGTTTCCQIDLFDLFKNGFSTGHGFLREPNSIMSFTALAAIAIQANQNDQHGGQSIPAFDYFMAPGVLKTFKKEFKQLIYDFLEVEGFLSFINFNQIEKDISKISSINYDVSELDKYAKESLQVIKIFRSAYDKALTKTNRQTYQAMEGFVHNLNTMHSRAGAQVPFSSVNLGTDISPEGRMVIKNFLLATEAGLGKGETPIFPISIFKVKDGINYKKTDPNYDLFELACRVSAKRLFPNFSFLDAPYNLQHYQPNNYKTEVGYMGCRTRVLANAFDKERQITPGRGNLSFTSINLVRLGIKYGIATKERDKANMKGFYKEIDELMELVKNQLLERLEIQSSKRVVNFPFLMGQGLWMDSAKLKPRDKVGKILGHGTLTFGFIGLAETLKALTGKHHGESKESQELGIEIIKHMRKICDDYSKEMGLNFSLIATPAEGLSGRFTSIDKSIYGIIPEVTDRDYYTNSFHVPVYYPTTIEQKIKTEAPYHALTNAGHISYIELDGDPTDNIDAFIKVIKLMKENGIGYGAVNHPVDRDPICGFVGVINDQCPGCGRTESEGVKFERIRRITGYLVGTVDRFNDGKKAEEHDRVKHS